MWSLGMMGKQEFKMAALVFPDDILGPFRTSKKIVYLAKFSVITNSIQVADKSWNVPPTKFVPGKYWTKSIKGLAKSKDNLFIRQASMVCQRIPPPLSTINPKSFSNFGISEFCSKRQFFASLVNQSRFNYTLLSASVYDKWLINLSRFVYLVDFAQFLPGTN